MGWQPDEEPGAGGESDPATWPPRARDPRLAGFAKDGEWDSRPPSAAVAAALEGVSGPGWRCPGASHDELLGALRKAAALESWACAGKLGLLRALMREEDMPPPGGDHHGDLPDGWSKSLTHEVALALAMSPITAEKLMWAAWDLEALLPGVGRLLEDGTLSYPKARAVNDALALLSERDKGTAEAMLLPDLAGKSHGQLEKLAARAAITVDPGIAERNREHAERNKARVVLKREQSGAAMLSGYDLPPAETLAAHAKVCTRAQRYKESGAFPGTGMDQLRAQAYLDLMNGVTAEARIAAGPPDTGLGAPGEGTYANDGAPADDDSGELAPGDPGSEDRDDSGGSRCCPCRECDGSCLPAGDDEEDAEDAEEDRGPGDDWPDDGWPGDGWPGDGWPDDDGPVGSSASPPSPPSPTPSSPWSPSSPALPRLTDLVLPLATLLGLAWRPGESHGFGPLDPALCRSLAALAATSPHTTVCVTVTDENGYAIGHGCLQSGRRAAPFPGAPAPPLTALPARLNLTVTATRLAELAGDPEPRGDQDSPDSASPAGWAFARRDGPEPGGSAGGADPPCPPGAPEWCGTWTLTLPRGLEFTVRLEPVPTWDCDHRRESHAYEPNGMLRHLVQVRDSECTFPTCSRHARESDFEHAIPYHKGGRTCGCNAGARSRQCHRVKQSTGWRVTQPRPGWHAWTTPSGRVYVQEPKRYPD